MSAKTDAIVQNLMESIINVGTPKTSAFDSIATVVRVEDDIAWVHFEGGAEETPARMTVNAKEGDVVQVRVSNNEAFLVGNSTAPPTDDTKAQNAQNTATRAVNLSNIAIDESTLAGLAAKSAIESAEEAAVAAEQADNAAHSAQESAQTANDAAGNALTQLSIVEDVVGTLNWITDHATYKLSEDTVVIPGKWYFTRSGSGTAADPYVYSVVNDPDTDPVSSGFYEIDSIDEAVSNYIETHLALTGRGLWLQASDQGGRILVSPTEGVIIFNSSGEAVATYGDTATIGDEDGFHINLTGTELGFYEGQTRVAYINNNTLHIAQSVVLTEMQLGENKWVWKIDPSDNSIYLKWIG